MFQWWIDTIGKLGPGIIALLVLFTTRGQNRRQNMTAVRAAQVEDQKFRLALLDRRLVAIDVVRALSRDFVIAGGATPELIDKLRTALSVAEMVYGEEQELDIHECILHLMRWSFLQGRQEHAQEAGEVEQYARAVENQAETEERVFDSLEALTKELIAATRVSTVPPIAPHRSFWGRLASRTRVRP